MLPIIHYLFDNFTFAQLTSPLTSIAFDIIYPIEVILHIANIGYLLDDILYHLLTIEVDKYSIPSPEWFFYLYIILSLASIKYRYSFYLLNISMVVFFSMGLYML
jgi:competence protein ComEC